MNRSRSLILMAPVALAFACSVQQGHWVELDAGSQVAAGSTNVGGTSAKAGGATSVGGTGAKAGGTSAGGSSTAGGTSATVSGAGGAISSGGTMTGGGSPATGGTPSTGGASAGGTGGTTPAATGGTKATGGTTGTVASGGTVSAGGAATGGVPTGGAATGGAATGGAATGGVPATGGAATGGSAAAVCPGTGGPSMVKLPQGYCIDSTEVTRSQYATWLATTPVLPASTDANCGWKSTASYAADATCMAGSTVCQGTACGNQPQVCVDWCDAYAYCAGVGKRLCGKIGGGTNLYADYADRTNASLSQWYNACSSAGANNYPYVGTYQSTACNGDDLAKNTTTAVGSLTGCQAPSPYAGVYDLSGNVWEWEDSCSGTGQTAPCLVRGGAFNDAGGSSYLACGFNGGYTRGVVSNLVGFRCCAP